MCEIAEKVQNEQGVTERFKLFLAEIQAALKVTVRSIDNGLFVLQLAQPLKDGNCSYVFCKNFFLIREKHELTHFVTVSGSFGGVYDPAPKIIIKFEPNPDLTLIHLKQLRSFFHPSISKVVASQSFIYLFQRGWDNQELAKELEISPVTVFRFRKSVTQ